MLVLFESPAGYAIFKVLDENKLQKTENLYKEFQSADSASRVLKLQHFQKFNDMTEALAAATATIEGKMSKSLKSALKKIVAKEAHETLAVADAKLGSVIKEKMNISCLTGNNIAELMRCIRSQSESLISGLSHKEATAMALGLAHSLSRYKLKFSPDKVDTMIIQAVSLLDDLDKELNNYMMRCKEWYGWHFPELSKIVSDNMAYIKTVKKVGMRTNVLNTDLSDILQADEEARVREVAEVSMGTEIAEDDINNIMSLCNEIEEMHTYRAQLHEYLTNRMKAIAPNLTVLVGELVGARLISHAGSLLNLSKQPASTVQILGAEKALFRALKTKHDTPKYGLIYHAQVVGQSSAKLKGKASRMLAAKTALAVRIDALGDAQEESEANDAIQLSMNNRAKVEHRLQVLEEGKGHRAAGSGRTPHKFDRYQHKSDIRQYNVTADTTVSSSKKKFKQEPTDEDDEENGGASTSFAPGKKIKREPEEDAGEQEEPPKKKKKKSKHHEQEEAEEMATQEQEEAPVKQKKKKKVKQEKREDTDSD